MADDLSGAHAPALVPDAPLRPRPREGVSRWRRDLAAGGTAGNERLTTLTGLVLIVLLAVLGITIVRIGQLLWLHLFLGLALLGPVALKLASTGYRFVRYYSSDPLYVREGPPPPALRVLAPLVVLFTLGVFATGVLLLFLGPASRGTPLLAHKVFFIAWLAVTAIHVLGHLPEILRLIGRARRTRDEIIILRTSPFRGGTPSEPSAPPRGDGDAESAVAGARGRAAALAIALIGGLVLAVALLGQFPAWTH